LAADIAAVNRGETVTIPNRPVACLTRVDEKPSLHPATDDTPLEPLVVADVKAQALTKGRYM
jgi:hypothetical protein